MIGGSVELIPDKDFGIAAPEGALIEIGASIVKGAARQSLESFDDIAFCFLDAEKEVYLNCYEALIPRMVRGAILVAEFLLGLSWFL